jgi:P27 family predicted phage terminase small subunit
MARGRPKTPTNLVLLRGNPGKRPLPKGEPRPAASPAVPEPPDYLGEHAKEEWERVAGELYHLGLLTNIDLPLFEDYCQSDHYWRLAVEAMTRMAAGDPVAHSLIIKSRNGSAIQNPLFLSARQSANDFIRAGELFGMGPAARARIAAGIGGFGPRPPSKFDGLLGLDPDRA